MNEDRNKTTLTRLVTQAVIGYLDERGCKPIETEVAVAEGWVADVAGVLRPTVTELVDLGFIKRRPAYNRPGYEGWWVKARELQQLLTVLVEVKTSRADFAKDRKWVLPLPVNVAYLALPSELAELAEKVPASWGILLYAGDCMRRARVPQICEVTTLQQRDVILEVAVRRDHDTRYERLRKLQKQIREQEAERRVYNRQVKAMSAMVAIVTGEHGSLEQCIEYHGLKFPAYFIPVLKDLWACRAKAVSA